MTSGGVNVDGREPGAHAGCPQLAVREESSVKSLDVIIPVRNDAERLARCLDSIAAQRPVEGVEVRIFVADNGSTDNSAAVARQASARVLDLPGLSVSALRNRAVAASRGEWIAFVDSDHELDPGWLASAVAAADNSQIAGLGSACDPPRHATWVQRIYDGLRHHPERVEATRWLGSGNLSVRRADFEEAGGFDETLETCEDVDLCLRLRAQGKKLMAVPGMRSIHYGDPATLRTLFRSELWRGRDNLRVSFRHGLGWRDLPSVGLPIAFVVAVLGLLAFVALGPAIGWAWTLLPASVLFLITSARAALMACRIRPRTPVGLAQVCAVAAVYEAARAGSLLVKIAHRRM